MAKKGKLKLVLGLAVPLVVLGAVAGLGAAGIVKIPGLSKKPPVQNYGEKDDKLPKVKIEEAKDPQDDAPKPKPPAKPKNIQPEPDPELGAKKLADVWNNIPTEKLVLIVAEYKDADLALVVSKMDREKTAEVLAALEPKRAAKLSKALEALGSVPPEPVDAG